ncbi:MAG: tetratricopeptide repeat protein, partial [Treponema sp.]|nr:tetratricopeptide repeat protein [Treponema sp.]
MNRRPAAVRPAVPPRRFFWAAVSVLPALLLPLLVVSQGFVSCVSSAAKAEEFYALGAAYFELKKYDEAAAWFEKAKFHRATRAASEYNLGRIAYEKGRYGEAVRYFEGLAAGDGENVTALRAAAYTYIKLDEPEKAEERYRRILALVPDSSDDGYNHALVLLALGRAAEAEEILVKYNNTEDPKALLLLARAQRKEG